MQGMSADLTGRLGIGMSKAATITVHATTTSIKVIPPLASFAKFVLPATEAGCRNPRPAGMGIWTHTVFEQSFKAVVETKCLSYRPALFPFRGE